MKIALVVFRDMEGITIEIVQDDRKEAKPLKKDTRKTSSYLTKYEYAKLLGFRALQLSHGSTPKVERDGRVDNLEIAKEEINKRVIPLVVVRKLPGGEKEIWKISELNIRSW